METWICTISVWRRFGVGLTSEGASCAPELAYLRLEPKGDGDHFRWHRFGFKGRFVENQFYSIIVVVKKFQLNLNLHIPEASGVVQFIQENNFYNSYLKIYFCNFDDKKIYKKDY